jgi:phosphopantetheinyl transferase
MIHDQMFLPINLSKVGVDYAAKHLNKYDFVVTLSIIDPALTALPPSSTVEKQIAGRYHDASRREGFLARRRIARAVLAEALNRPAAEIEIGADSYGAPLVLTPSGQFHLSFSARGAGALIGIARRPIGVDLEIIQSNMAIPWNMLRDDERTTLANLPKEHQAAAFGRLWSAKEAVVKALGCGFRLPPEAISLGGWEQGETLEILDIKATTGAFMPEIGWTSRQTGLKLESKLIEPEWTGGLVVVAACIA